MPRDILSWALQDCFLSSNTGVTWDLDARKVYGLNLNLLGLDKTIQQKLFERIAHMGDSATPFVTMKMSTTEEQSDFNDFQALQELADSIDGHMPGANGFVRWLSNRKAQTPLAIVLRIKLATTSSLENPMNQERTLDIKDIEHGAFPLLSDVLWQWPGRGDDKCPELVKDGTGKFHHAIYPKEGRSRTKSWITGATA
ncbi:hypothetical protein K458DRAFT_395877 [Lentithecium fluviatile CBS 122367]|uniref:Uncharacterized protein n=1 Tax=Lentithecium fluviatile CBS 122367 TaxID=1168545 RepID=A0A6G1II81_9PLEO|nr:hypothetical protein K458DRAFT_395877 [Lentithecium fluviatile CBS 122367]